MDKVVRYRVYGVMDDTYNEGISNVLDEMRQYGSACIVDVEIIIPTQPECTDAQKDFLSRFTPINCRPKKRRQNAKNNVPGTNPE